MDILLIIINKCSFFSLFYSFYNLFPNEITEKTSFIVWKKQLVLNINISFEQSDTKEAYMGKS